MTTPKHPTRVIYHHDSASLPAELHAQYEVRQAPRVDTVEATERLASLLVNVARTVGARVAIADEAARAGDAEERDRVNEATAKMLIKTIDALSSRLSAPGNAPIASALYVARRMFDDFVARTPHLPPHMVARSRLD